jgi:uncharacterized protein (DUF1697 family)
MVYAALLRGINVDSKNIVEMARLKQPFEELGFISVKNSTNSGNVIFRAERMVDAGQIEERILRDFGLNVPVLLRDLPAMTRLIEGLPGTWVNDTTKVRRDVLVAGHRQLECSRADSA